MDWTLTIKFKNTDNIELGDIGKISNDKLSLNVKYQSKRTCFIKRKDISKPHGIQWEFDH